MQLFISISLSVLLFISCQTSNPQKNESPALLPAWNASMQDMKRELMTLQPYIFNATIFNDPDNHEFLSQKIHQLSLKSSTIKHDYRIENEDPTVKFVSMEFADELERADKNFKGGWTEYTRSQLVKVTSYCLECHTRLRQGPSFIRNENEEIFTKTLPTADRIELMIAFRQFEPAFNLALEYLSESQKNKNINYKAERVARLGLLVAVQYMKNYERAKKIVDIIELNTSLPIYLKRQNKSWKQSLEKWDSRENLNNLTQVRLLADSRISEIDDMRIINALLSLLTGHLKQNELGEALFLTGQSYEELYKISVMSLHENYYEECIRKAAATKWAPLCLTKLTDSIILGYTGSSGTRVPKDVTARLNQLRKIIKDARR